MISLKLVILAPAFIFAVIGFAFDGGRALNARAATDDVAVSAARAAAGGIERTAEGAVFTEEAIALAEAYILRQPNVTGSATLLSDTEVQVTIQGTYDPVIIPGGATFTYQSTETTEAQLGVQEGGDTGG